MECACGCGETVTDGVNPRSRRPIRYRSGHARRLCDSLGGDVRARELRDRWPTKRELEQLLEQLGTQSAVARHLGRSPAGMRYIVKSLGVSYTPNGSAMPKSTARLGWNGEEHAAMILGAELARAQHFRDSPFDLFWHGLRVEVKTALPSLAGPPPGVSGWSFSIGRNAGKSDVFFCICCDEGGLPRAYFLLPASVMPASTLRIPLSLRTKWIQYRWLPELAPRPPWLS